MQRQQEMMKNLLIDLPEDLFINNILLSKVMLNKSLLSLRCVCKYLRNIITSPAFVNMHLLHQSTTASSLPNHHQQLNNNQLVLFHSLTHQQVFYSLKFNDGDPCRPEEVNILDYPIKDPLLIWGSCNGLLCLTQRDYRRDPIDIVCLWNPSTKEYKELPPPPPPLQLTERVSIMNYGFGYDRLNDDYKIIRGENFMAAIYGDHTDCITEFQVYTLGTKNTWRKISADNNPFKSYRISSPAIQQSIVFVNGALHWIMTKPLERSPGIIVSFDIEKEVFGEIQKPNDNFFSPIHVLRGCLCLFEDFYNCMHLSCCFNVWMMMDYGVKESWTILFTIDGSELLNWTSYYDGTVRLLRFCENGEIVIGTKNTLIAYDPMNHRARRVEFGESVHLGESINCSEIYIESLVSLNSGIYKG